MSVAELVRVRVQKSHDFRYRKNEIAHGIIIAGDRTRIIMKAWIPAIPLIALWAIVLTILLTPEIPHGHGFAHSRFEAMDQGGDGFHRHQSFLITGWAFGSVLIALFVSLLAWATVRRPIDAGTASSDTDPFEKLDLHFWSFLFGGLIYEGVFAMMCLAYWNSLTGPDVVFVGPFPAGVSWLLFGIWMVPAYFIVLYVVFFNRWIMPPESMRRFKELARPACQSDDRK